MYMDSGFYKTDPLAMKNTNGLGSMISIQFHLNYACVYTEVHPKQRKYINEWTP